MNAILEILAGLLKVFIMVMTENLEKDKKAKAEKAKIKEDFINAIKSKDKAKIVGALNDARNYNKLNK